MKETEKNPLHQKYRPKTFDEIAGSENQRTVKPLKTLLKDGNVHTFLLVGPSGCGKTTIARLIKDALGCSNSDFKELNGGNDRGIGSIREIIYEEGFFPRDGDVKVILIDECHRLTPDSMEALLKVIEEPAPGTYFIFATTNPEKLLVTFKNRCTPFRVSPLNREEMRILLNGIIEKEDAHLTPRIVGAIITMAEGSPRQALVLLELVINLEDERSMLDALEGGEEEPAALKAVIQSLLFDKNWNAVVEYFTNPDPNPEKIRRAILTGLANILLSETAADTTKEQAARITSIFSQPTLFGVGNSSLVHACWKVIHDTK
jgi:DNA polymerase-3 subunit gamma/tau